MEPALISAIISGATALAVTAATSILIRHRERDAEWRKMKLERYQEYLTALSGTVGRQAASPANQTRYSHAFNNLLLIAPENVLRALYVFAAEIGPRNTKKSAESHDRLLTELLTTIRKDMGIPHEDFSGTTLWMMDSPLASEQASDSQALPALASKQ